MAFPANHKEVHKNWANTMMERIRVKPLKVNKSKKGPKALNYLNFLALTELIKNFNQVLANHLRVATFNVMPFYKVYQLTILK